MKTNKKLTISLAALALAGIAVYLVVKKQADDEAEILDNVAEEGYETAHDILYPLKIQRKKKNRNF